MTTSPSHHSPGSLILSLNLYLSLSLFFTACPEKNNPPPMADCDPGWHPCGTDSTECCLDTTSHNFVWEIDTLGDYGSYLNDVAIIDENNIWVVGYIKEGDSTYNAAHWDGGEWHLVKLLYTGTPPGSHSGTIQPGQALHALSTGEIFIVAGTTFYWDGSDWEELYVPWGIFNGAVTELWGTSSSDMYLVGGNGSIVHYDGSGFEKMESLPGQGGTDAHIIDIWGLDDKHVWVVTYSNPPIINEVLFYNGNIWSTIYERITDNWPPEDYTKPSGTFRSVWAWGDSVYISCASLWRQSISTGEGRLTPLEDMHWGLGWGTGHVRGNSRNDIFVTTSFGSEVSHFNGKDWRFYSELKAMDPDGHVATRGLAIKGDIVVIAGENYVTERAIVYRGYR